MRKIAVDAIFRPSVLKMHHYQKIAFLFSAWLLVGLGIAVPVLAQFGPFVPCTTLGQTPSSAFPVCGDSKFHQDLVPSCGGTRVPVPPCNDGAFYSDIRPFFYKFSCFQTGTLGFTITPKDLTDDYDWQIFDITGKDPDDIYTDPTMFFCANWSGNSGVTGTDVNLVGSDSFQCSGWSTNKLSTMPTVLKNHEYLLLVSNFSPSPLGYDLSFLAGASGVPGTAVITDPLPPAMGGAFINCEGTRLGIKLNKKMLCGSLSPDGSDFTIGGNPGVLSVKGRGCPTGFDMDSVTIYFANRLPPGTYQIAIQNGTDGNTITDLCANGIPVGQSASFTVPAPGPPTVIEGIDLPIPCATDSVRLRFKTPIKCSTVAADGSDFLITGPAPVQIKSAVPICDTDLMASTIVLYFMSPVSVSGLYTVSLQVGTDLSTIINECGVPTPVGSSFSFKASGAVPTDFSFSVRPNCTVDTIACTYLGTPPGSNNVNYWKWYLLDTLKATNTLTPVFNYHYDGQGTKNIKLVVGNDGCTDSLTKTFDPGDRFLKAGFSLTETICPGAAALFQDTSLGDVQQWEWDFGNGQFSNAQVPGNVFYPVLAQYQQYPVRLRVWNDGGCSDSTGPITITVKPRPRIVPGTPSLSACSPDRMTVRFNQPLSCVSVTADGSQFSVSGPVPALVIGASPLNCQNGFADSFIIFLDRKLVRNGNYRLSTQLSKKGDSAVGDCSVRMADTTITFSLLNNVSAAFDTLVRVGCLADTLQAWHNGAATQWLWFFDGSLLSFGGPRAEVVYSDFSVHRLELVASNGICSDTIFKNIVPQDHGIKAGFIGPDSTCPGTPLVFKDTSKGNIVSWQWDFGNAQQSLLPFPPAISYPAALSTITYPVRLIVTNATGCIDTAGPRPLLVFALARPVLRQAAFSGCSPKTIELSFSGKLRCGSISADGSQFMLSGITGLQVISALPINCVNGYTDSILLELNSPILSNGAYSVTTRLSGTGKSLEGFCDIRARDTVRNFSLTKRLSARFDTSVSMACRNDTLRAWHNGNGNANSWQWILDSVDFRTGQIEQFVYDAAVKHRLRLIVGNGTCEDTADLTIVPAARPTKAGFQSPDTVCPGERVVFSDASIGRTVSWQWDFGNGGTAMGKYPLPTSYPDLPTNKDYPVRLEIANFAGCKDATVKWITVRAKRPAKLDSAVVVNCKLDQLSLNFSNAISCASIEPGGGNFTVTGPGGPVVLQAVALNCKDGAAWQLLLTLKDKLAEGMAYRLSVHADAAGKRLTAACGTEVPDGGVGFGAPSLPKARFDTLLKTGCTTDTLVLNYTGGPAATDWLWKFDNSDTASGKKATFVYDNFGTKQIRLIASDPNCADTSTLSFVPPDRSVVAAFLVGSNPLCPGDKLSLENQSVGDIVRYEWDFGFSNSNRKDPAPVQFPSLDTLKTYTVTLRAKNKAGCIDSAQVPVSVYPAKRPELYGTGQLTCSPERMVVRFSQPLHCRSFAFDGSGFKVAGPSPVSISSVVPRCVNGFAETAELFFRDRIAMSGLYSLSIANASDGTLPINYCLLPLNVPGVQLFRAYGRVDASFDTSVSLGCLHDTVRLWQRDRANATTWEWRLDNLTSPIAIGPEATLSFQDLSPKIFSLTVGNQRCTDTKTKMIVFPNQFDTIRASAVVQKEDGTQYDFTQDVVCPMDKLRFVDKSTGEIQKWHWDFGNGHSSEERVPDWESYQAIGNATVSNPKLRVTGKYCNDEFPMQVKAVPSCGLEVPSGFTPNADGKNDQLRPLNGYRAKELIFVVYNRFGKKVFESYDWRTGWDGNYNGTPQPSGTYIWLLSYYDTQKNTTRTSKGTSVLIR